MMKTSRFISKGIGSPPVGCRDATPLDVFYRAELAYIMPEWIIPDAKTQRFSFLLFDRFSNHGFANALEPLRAANTFLGRTAYDWRILPPCSAAYLIAKRV